MKMKKSITLLTILALIVVMLAGCGQAPAAPTESKSSEASTEAKSDSATGNADAEKKLKLAFISTSNIDESMKWFQKNFEEEATAKGFEYACYDPNGDVQKQVNMVGDAIAAQVDGIVMQALDKKALIPAFQKAKEAGVVITLFGADIDESGWDYRDFVCAPDDLAAGKLAGETLVEHFPDGATGVEIMGGPGEDPSTKREMGFDEGIKGSKITVLDRQNIANWDPAKAMATMEDFITKYGDKIQFVYSHWDNASTTICEALEAKGMLENVYILSVDGCRAGFDLVNSGKIAATMFQDMAMQVKECVNAVEKIKNGEKVDPIKFVPWQVITKENANFDPGW
jgi:ABC-type sugar transport system substrate-binding protein